LAIAVVLVAALHLALLWLASRPVQMPVPPDHRVWIQLLRPVPVAPPPRVMSPQAPPQAQPARNRAQNRSTGSTAPRVSRESTASASAPAVEAAPPQAAVPAPSPAPYSDPLAAPPAAAPSAPATLPPDVLQQALKAAGAIDRELRTERRQSLSLDADSVQAKLDKGFAAAHAAVKPKWYEKAQVELFSAPNDPRRIYQITTALGTYCLFYPDKASMSVNSSAGSGHASFGQPLMGSCPQRF
jgi:hypothetical protein